MIAYSSQYAQLGQLSKLQDAQSWADTDASTSHQFVTARQEASEPCRGGVTCTSAWYNWKVTCSRGNCEFRRGILIWMK